MKAWSLRKRSFWNFQSYDSCKQTILELQKTLRSSLVNLTLVMNTIFKQTQVMTKLCWQDKIVVWWSKFKFSNGKYIPKSNIFLCEFNWRNNPNSTSYPLSSRWGFFGIFHFMWLEHLSPPLKLHRWVFGNSSYLFMSASHQMVVHINYQTHALFMVR